MRHDRALATILLLALAGGTGWWLLCGSRASPLVAVDVAEPVGGVDPPRPAATLARDAEPTDPARIRTRPTPTFLDRALRHTGTASEPPTAAAISGRLAWRPDGTPVIGAVVTLVDEPLDTLAPPLPDGIEARPASDPVVADAATTTTDDRGRFTLSGLPPRGRWFLRFDLAGGGSDLHDVRAWPEPGADRWQGEYAIDRRGTLVGAVTDADGRPVEDAQLRAVDEFRFDDDTVPGSVRAERAQDLATVQADGVDGLSRWRRDTRTRDLRLPFPTARSDANGRFRLPGVRAGDAELVATHPDHPGVSVPVPVVADQDVDVGTVVLGDGAPITVRILDTTRKPVAGLPVSVRRLGMRFGPAPRVTDRDGAVRFVLARPDADLDAVRAEIDTARRAGRPRPRHHDWYRVAAQLTPTARFAHLGSGALDGEEFRLEPPLSLPIALVSAPGEPWTAASASTGPGGEPAFAFVPHSPHLAVVRTGVASYRIDGIVRSIDALTTLIVRADGHGPGAIPDLGNLAAAHHADLVAGNDRGPAPVTLPDTWPAEIRVVDGGGRPRSDVEVTVDLCRPLDALPRRLPLGITDAAGELRIAALWTGAAGRLWLHHPELGTLPDRTREFVRGLPIVLTFPEPAIVSGALGHGAERARRRYRLVATHRPPGDDPALALPDVETESTDDGTFRFPPLVPQEVWRFAVTEPEAVTTRAGQRREPDVHATVERALQNGANAVDFDVGDGDGDATHDGTWTGTVAVDGFAPDRLRIELHGWRNVTQLRREAGRQVRRTVEQHRIVDQAVPDSSGRFALRADRSQRRSRLRLVLRLPTGELPLWIDTEDPTAGPLAIRIGSGALTATVLDGAGRPAVGRIVELRSADAEAPGIAVIVDGSGTLHAAPLPAGSYEARLRDGAREITLAPFPLRIEAGAATLLSLSPR